MRGVFAVLAASLLAAVDVASAQARFQVQVTKYTAVADWHSGEPGADEFTGFVTVLTNGGFSHKSSCLTCTTQCIGWLKYEDRCSTGGSLDTGMRVSDATEFKVVVEGWEDDHGDRCAFNRHWFWNDDDHMGSMHCRFPVRSGAPGVWRTLRCGDHNKIADLRVMWFAETPAPATPAPKTDAPPTSAPPTVSPPTPAPETDAPPTSAPPTSAPPTASPPTPAPETDAPAPATEREALRAMKEAFMHAGTGGRMLTWTSDEPCVDWEGIDCDSEGSVTVIMLDYETTLRPAVLPDLSVMTKLLRLYVQGTAVTGFAGLPTSLLEVDFSLTQVNGTFPEAVLSLDRLMTVRARGSRLTGEVPRFQDSLRHIDVSQNQLTGQVSTLPLSILNFLAWDNQLSGPLPPSHPNVLRLALNNNRFTGGVPLYPKLQVAQFHFNDLSGPLDITNLPVAYHIDVSRNSFSGDLPNFAGTRVWIFQAHSNQFTGPFHFAQPGQKVMFKLMINNNKLTGREPTAEERALVAEVCTTFDNPWTA
eukprot:TRINITY_DN1621_c0_g1_i10.p1 TRINITY_DN1621_c0_g1~~TRINITY_DN1621_c0_g1_i10.p1  ORF type:complete len:532 (+),score=194.06 TRINITY_DN1621_c0_g1_i10:61-1656(+)